MSKPHLHIYHRTQLDGLPLLADSPAMRDLWTVTRGVQIPNSADLVFVSNAPFDMLKKEMTRPFVLWCAGHYWYEWRNTPGRIKNIEAVMRKADTIVCVSKYLRRLTLSKIDHPRVVGLPNGLWGTDHVAYKVNPARFTRKTDYTIKGDPLVVMCISLADEIKWRGVPIFWDAVQRVLKTRKVKLVCAGRMSGRKNIVKRWREQFGIKYQHWARTGAKFDFTKGLGDPHWPALLNKADVFVHPSMWDSWGCAVADAMYSAVPGLVFDVTGQSEIGDSFIKVDPNNSDQIEFEFERLLDDVQYRRDVGQAMYEEAMRKTRAHRHDLAHALLEVLK